MILTRNERVCLFVIRIIREFDLYVKKIFLRDSVLNKDRMGVDCFIFFEE